MRLLFFIPLFLFCAGAQVNAQSDAIALLAIPDSLRESAHSVIQSYDLEYEVTSPRTATVRYRKVITLLNGKHDREHLIGERYDGDTKITTFEVAATDAFGRAFFTAAKRDITDERMNSDNFHDDSWVKHVTVPVVSYPATITVTVEKKLSDFAMMNFPNWVPVARNQSLIASTFVAKIPLENEMLYRGDGVGEPEMTSDGKVKTYRWEIRNRTAEVSEPLCPSEWETLPHVLIGLNDFQIDDYRGSFRNWNTFGGFIYRIMDGLDELPPRLVAEVHETVEPATTRRDTIDRLYRFMQKRCRYVSIQLGIGGWQPFSASYVDENRYGDCKALSNYMGAMLREVGIPSFPVLIHRSDRPYLDVPEDFAISLFNHMVLYVPSEDMYLECTSTDEPTGYLSDDKEDRNVLWITPDGGQLARTPSLRPGDHGHVRSTRLAITEANEMSFDYRATYFGAAQETFRQLGAYIGNRQDQLDWLHQHNYLPDVTGSAYTYEVSEARPEVEMAYTTSLRNRVRKMGSRKFVAVNPFPIDWVPDQMTDRQLPLVYSDARYFVDTIRITFPENLEIETGLFTDPLVYTHPVGEYQAKIKLVGNEIVWTRTLRLEPVELPADEYNAFRQFFVDKAKAENLQLVFKERQTK
ncbi:transglutaminase superfamily protein [Neolewinella xylanilytica]|uniref:Transglutaminase superfamily protein n=1 Tax=Neolewinella xylanilytica TaxID=1514080 RepID=A0A2S6I4Z6_9BACT|nr:DUF3857 domain-containing protein [Neolewinella xylanilytica]PPK86246.1 transglutaminase superfamily protein [Neolewinella xylanilytica]